MGSWLRYTGRSWWHVDESESSLSFGPEGLYRMEPRRFFLWGFMEFPSHYAAAMSPMVV